jgi:hypothetical protein
MHTLPIANEGEKPRAAAINGQLRVEALQAQNVEEGLDRFIRHFKDLEPVAATFCVEPGVHWERRWAFYVQQGSRRYQLAS